MNLARFMAPPSRAEWQWALNHGWSGPDGSSSSTDHIMGVRIGITSTEWAYSTLPANLHDWRYFLGRLLGLPETYRREADKGYHDDCLAEVNEDLHGWKLFVARVRCRARYAALRMGARFAWTSAQRMRNIAWRWPHG